MSQRLPYLHDECFEYRGTDGQTTDAEYDAIWDHLGLCPDDYCLLYLEVLVDATVSCLPQQLKVWLLDLKSCLEYLHQSVSNYGLFGERLYFVRLQQVPSNNNVRLLLAPKYQCVILQGYN